jgi:hypothetical protein
MRIGIQSCFVIAAFTLLTVAVGARGGEAIVWSSYADEQTVKVVTTNEDGSSRETTVWLVVVEGQGYIRTGKTRWGGNIERNPDVALRIGETELTLRVAFVSDEVEREAVVTAFRDKYGFSDWILGPFRRGEPKIMRLMPRSAP